MNLVNKITLSEQIYTILRNDIINQSIKCGEKLTIKNLMERFEVSSTPIREALTRLTQDDLVSYYSNIGVRVIEFSKNDIAQIYDFYKELDCIAVKFSFKNVGYKVLENDLQKVLNLSKSYLECGDLEKFRKSSDDFHDVFYSYANNSKLMDAAIHIRGQFSILTKIYQSYTINATIVNNEHTKIYESVQKNDLYMALDLLDKHFDHSKNYLLNNLPANI